MQERKKEKVSEIERERNEGGKERWTTANLKKEKREKKVDAERESEREK